MKKLSALIAACRKYDRSSQNELFHKYADQVMNLARRYVHDDYKAKDVFLRSFEKALNNINRYDETKESFSSWLNRITINEALNQIKSDRRFVFEEVKDEKVTEVIEPVDNIDYDKVIRLIDELRMPYGIIFNMIQEGYKHKEVAERFNITEATSRSYYKRSRQMIRAKISEQQLNELQNG